MSDIATEHKDAPDTPEPRRTLNIYTCESCGFHIVTKDVDVGTTPFMIPCEALACEGRMLSSMYAVFDQNMRPGYHWYKPAAPEWGALSPGELEHVRKGGLLLRKADGGRTNFDTLKRGRT